MRKYYLNPAVLLAFTLCAASVNPAGADPLVTVEAGVDLASAYLWRGYVLADAPCVQPSVTLFGNEQPFTLNLWGSLALDERADWEEADEVDVSLDWTRETVLGDRTWIVSAGYVAYLMPSAETTFTEELYLALGLDTFGSPTVETYYDFVDGHCWYVRPGVGHEWEGTSVTASLSAASGFSDAEQAFGFHDAEVAASLSWSAGSFTLGPTFGASFARESVDPDEARLWGLFGVSWSSAP